MIWRDYVLCYILRLLENFAENILDFFLKIMNISNIFGNFGKFTSYYSQSWREIMTLGGIDKTKMVASENTKIDLHSDNC